MFYIARSVAAHLNNKCKNENRDTDTLASTILFEKNNNKGK